MLETEIQQDETATELRARLAVVGADLLVDVLSVGAENLGEGDPQEGDITYAAKIDPAELELHLDETAVELSRVVRIGRAWTTFRGSRLIIARARPHEDAAASVEGPPGTLSGTSVATGGGVLELLEVQPEGRKRVERANGYVEFGRHPESASAPELASGPSFRSVDRG